MSLLVWILDLWLAAWAPLMVMPGEQWQEDLPKRMPKEWWALCGEQLVRATSRVRPAKSEISDMAGYLAGYVSVSVRECKQPTLLVRGVAGLRAGHIETAKVEKFHQISWQGRRFEMVSEDDHGVSLGVARLSDGRTTQILVPHVELAHVIWAGDLDGDGELDLLLEMNDGDDTGEYILFTSRGRAPGELLHRAAAARNDDHC